MAFLKGCFYELLGGWDAFLISVPISDLYDHSSGSSGYVSPFGPVETPRYANSLPRWLNELVLLLMLTLGLGGAHVGDGKGSFNCDGEDGGGDNEDWEG